MGRYKGISFPKGYKTTFGKFQKDFANHKVFLDVPHKDKEAEMKKAFDQLNDHSDKNPSESESQKPETKKNKKDGNSEATTRKSEASKPE